MTQMCLLLSSKVSSPAPSSNISVSLLLVTKMSVDELHQLNTELLMQIQSKCYFLFFFCVKWGKAAKLTQPLGHIRLSGPYEEKRCLISQPSQRWSMGLIKLEGFSTQHIMSCYVTTSVELVTVLVHTPPLLSLHPSSLMVRLHQKGSKFSQRLLSQLAAVNSPLFAPVGTQTLCFWCERTIRSTELRTATAKLHTSRVC